MRTPQPRVTLWLLGLTSAAWLLAVLLGLAEWIAEPAGFIAARVDGYEVAEALPLWLTPLSSTLVHAGIVHLGFNMLMLGYCGRAAEFALGGWGLLIVYGVGAYVAAAFQYVWSPYAVIPMVGASGAISAVVGAYALLYGRRREGAGMWFHVVQLAAAWIVVQLLVGFATWRSGMSVAIPAHIGGFIAGLLLVRPLLVLRRRRLLASGTRRDNDSM